MNCRLFADVEKLLRVPATMFVPPPKVDSVVVQITPRGIPDSLPPDPDDPDDVILKNLWTIDSYRELIIPSLPEYGFDWSSWDYLLKICFSFKNKTLSASLTTKSVVAKLLKTRGYVLRGLPQKGYDISRRTLDTTSLWDGVSIDHFRNIMSLVLTETGLSRCRPNGMTEFEFRRLYVALRRMGCI